MPLSCSIFRTGAKVPKKLFLEAGWPEMALVFFLSCVNHYCFWLTCKMWQTDQMFSTAFVERVQIFYGEDLWGGLNSLLSNWFIWVYCLVLRIFCGKYRRQCCTMASTIALQYWNPRFESKQGKNLQFAWVFFFWY